MGRHQVRLKDGYRLRVERVREVQGHSCLHAVCALKDHATESELLLGWPRRGENTKSCGIIEVGRSRDYLIWLQEGRIVGKL